MAPRVRARRAGDYDREVAALLRLRNAVVIDPDLKNAPDTDKVLSLVDELVQVVIGLKQVKSDADEKRDAAEEESAKSDESGELPYKRSRRTSA